MTDNESLPRRNRVDSMVDADIAITTVAIMTLGILVAILGTAAVSQSSGSKGGLILLGIGGTLIVGQYVGVTRRIPFYLALVNGILIGFSLLSGLLSVILPPMIAICMITATMLFMNWHHRATMAEQDQAGVPKPEFGRVTMREILGAFVVLALILGPATFVSRWLQP